MAAKKRKRKNQPKLSLGAMVGLIGAGVVVIAVALFAFSGYHGPDRWIYVTEEMDNAALRDTLKSTLGTAQGMRTYILYKLQGGSASRSLGAYCAANGQSALTFSHRLARGRETPVTVTFTSARTMDEVAGKISSKLAFSKQDFLNAARGVLADSGYTIQTMAGAFIPDTYEFYWGAGPEKVVKRLLEYRSKFWNANRLSKARRLGITPMEAATIASIVEEETSKKDEMPMVARVYLNRLRKGMRLQADPTVKFAAGDPTIKRITGEHLSIQSPYNTYRVKGLPPGPIRIPSGKTIDAVLDAPVKDYMFMCARPDFSGYHDYTSSFQQHKSNAARYQAALDKIGIQ